MAPVPHVSSAALRRPPVQTTLATGKGAITRDRNSRTATWMTLDEAAALLLSGAPPMTPIRWAQLRPLLDAQAVAGASGPEVSRHTMDNRE
jgi:hypothetical protein